jgi:hypothetical protein
MAPLDFEIPPKPEKTFTAHLGPPENVGEHIELRPMRPIHERYDTTILAFCLPLDEARELGLELLRLTAKGSHNVCCSGPV